MSLHTSGPIQLPIPEGPTFPTQTPPVTTPTTDPRTGPLAIPRITAPDAPKPLDFEAPLPTPGPAPVEAPAEGLAAPVTTGTSTIAPPAEPKVEGLTAPEITSTATITPPVETKVEGLAAPEITKDVTFFGVDKEGKQKEFKTLAEADKSISEKAARDASAAKQKELELARAGLLEDASDLTKQSLSFFKDLADPNTPDAVYDRQVNQFMSTIGPQNLQLTNALNFQIKQAGLSDQPAGNALLFMMARNQGKQISQVVAGFNTESAQRVIDANKWGLDAGIRVRQQVNREIQQDFDNNGLLFSTAAEVGDTTTMEDVWSRMSGGLPLDTESFARAFERDEISAEASLAKDLGVYKPMKSLALRAFPQVEFDEGAFLLGDTARQSTFESRMVLAEQILDPEKRKAAMIEIAKVLPEFFGYPGDPDGAVRAVGLIDFKDSAAVTEKKIGIEDDMRALAIQDTPNLDIALGLGNQLYENDTPEQISTKFDNAVKILGADELQEILTALTETTGVTSLAEIDTNEEKKDFLSIKRFMDMQRDAGGVTSDEIYAQMQKEIGDTSELTEWFTDPLKKEITRDWIGQAIVDKKLITDPLTGQVTVDFSSIVPPWSPESRSQPNYLTWPSMYDADGALFPADSRYAGDEPWSDIDKNGVVNSADATAVQQELTKSWNTFKSKNPDTTWLEWYHGTKGNTAKFSDANVDTAVTAGVLDETEVATRAAPTVLDKAEAFREKAITEFTTALESGDFSAIDDNEFFSILQDNPGAITELGDSEGVQTLTTTNVTSSSLIRRSDFTKLGLTADVEIEGIISDGNLVNGPDVGAGNGNGSIIIIDGRPARVTQFFSAAKQGITGGVSARQGNIWVVFLDEDPKTREEVRIGGSNDFVDV